MSGKIGKRLRQAWSLVRCWRNARHALSTLASLQSGDGVADALGGLTDEEVAFLVRKVSEASARGPVVFIEIGTLFGFTARAVAQRCPNVRVVAVDNFSWNPFGLPPDAHERFARRVLGELLEGGRLTLVRGDARAYLAGLDGPNGRESRFVFLDGDHRYASVLEEIKLCRRAGVEYLAGHDYGNALFGVTDAVRETLSKPTETGGMCWFRAAHGVEKEVCR